MSDQISTPSARCWSHGAGMASTAAPLAALVDAGQVDPDMVSGDDPLGWDSQLGDEFTAQLQYQRKLRVDAGGFEQLGELGADAGDAVEVDHVGPVEDVAVGDARFLGEFGALLLDLGVLEEGGGIGYAGFAELLAVGGADAFDVFDFVVGHVGSLLLFGVGVGGVCGVSARFWTLRVSNG